MVILRDSKTGKYYIAPSPPSFYQSKTPSTSGGSSSGYQLGDVLTPPGSTSSGSTEERGAPTPTSAGQLSPSQNIISGGGGSSSGGGGSSSGYQLGDVLTPPGSTSSGKLVYYDTPPVTEERGFMTVTDPYKAEVLKNKGVVYYQPIGESPAELITEGDFMVGIPQKSGVIQSKGNYEYNLKNIIAGQETYRQYKKEVDEFKADPSSFEGRTGVTATEVEGGIQYQLTPEYFESKINFGQISKDALVGAKNQFNLLPLSTMRKLYVGGFVIGATSMVIGGAEFGGNIIMKLKQQTFKPGQSIFEKRSFKFGGTLGRIRSTPSTESTVTFLESPISWAKQKIRSPEFLGSAQVIIPLAFAGVSGFIGSAKAYGIKTAIAETASGFSPIKIRPGIYAEAITKDTTFKNIRSYKSTTNKITTRIYYGSSGSVQLSGVERSTLVGGKVVGGGYSVTKTPFLEIRGGGMFVKQGVRTITSPYIFGSAGSGTAYGGIGNNFYTQMVTPLAKGGISTVVYSRGVTSYGYNTGGGYSLLNSPNKIYTTTSGSGWRNVNNRIKLFSSGNTKPIYEIVKSGDLTVYQPSGRYRFIPRMSGVEFDLTKLGGGGGEYSGGGVIKTVTKLKTFGGLKTIITPSTPTTNYKPTTTLLPTTTKKSGRYTAVYPTITKMKPITIITEISGTDTGTIVVPDVKNIQRGGSSTKQTLIIAPIIDTITKPKQKENVITIPSVVQVRKVILKQPQRQTYTGFSGYGFGGSPPFPPSIYAPTIPIPIPPIPLFAGGGLGLSMGNIGLGQSPTKYTPSFRALFFKIRGKAPKGVKTGIEFRPITKGFSFQGIRKIRVRRVKI